MIKTLLELRITLLGSQVCRTSMVVHSTIITAWSELSKLPTRKEFLLRVYIILLKQSTVIVTFFQKIKFYFMIQDADHGTEQRGTGQDRQSWSPTPH